jgi:hypothetical protein
MKLALFTAAAITLLAAALASAAEMPVPSNCSLWRIGDMWWLVGCKGIDLVDTRYTMRF